MYFCIMVFLLFEQFCKKIKSVIFLGQFVYTAKKEIYRCNIAKSANIY